MSFLNKPNGSRFGFENSIVEPLIVAVIYVIFVCSVGPWWEVYQFNTDEGLNLSTAALMAFACGVEK